MNDTVTDHAPGHESGRPDLDAIEADFDRVERSLQQLADGTYDTSSDLPGDDIAIDSTSPDAAAV